jgi:hypothetical protein
MAGGRLGGAEDMSSIWGFGCQHDPRPFHSIMEESHAQLCDALQSRLQSRHRRGGAHDAAVHLLLTEVTDGRLKLWQQTRAKSTDEIGAMHGL